MKSDPVLGHAADGESTESTDVIECWRDDVTLYLDLARPDRGNALSPVLVDTLTRAIDVLGHGFLSRVVPADRLDGELEVLIARCLSSGGVGAGLGKHSFRHQAGTDRFGAYEFLTAQILGDQQHQPPPEEGKPE